MNKVFECGKNSNENNKENWIEKLKINQLFEKGVVSEEYF